MNKDLANEEQSQKSLEVQQAQAKSELSDELLAKRRKLLSVITRRSKVFGLLLTLTVVILTQFAKTKDDSGNLTDLGWWLAGLAIAGALVTLILQFVENVKKEIDDAATFREGLKRQKELERLFERTANPIDLKKVILWISIPLDQFAPDTVKLDSKTTVDKAKFMYKVTLGQRSNEEAVICGFSEDLFGFMTFMTIQGENKPTVTYSYKGPQASITSFLYDEQRKELHTSVHVDASKMSRESGFYSSLDFAESELALVDMAEAMGYPKLKIIIGAVSLLSNDGEELSFPNLVKDDNCVYKGKEQKRLPSNEG